MNKQLSPMEQLIEYATTRRNNSRLLSLSADEYAMDAIIAKAIELLTSSSMSCHSKEQLDNMLEDVVNELDLSQIAIEKHGPLGTPPAELVRLVLEQKNMEIRALKAGFSTPNKTLVGSKVVTTEEVYRWVKVSDEPLPKLGSRQKLSIRYKGVPNTLEMISGTWHWDGEEQPRYAVHNDSLSAIEWLRPVSLSDLIREVADKAFEAGMNRQWGEFYNEAYPDDTIELTAPDKETYINSLTKTASNEQ